MSCQLAKQTLFLVLLKYELGGLDFSPGKGGHLFFNRKSMLIITCLFFKPIHSWTLLILGRDVHFKNQNKCP